jgi:branched-subunit amino acid transport protein
VSVPPATSWAAIALAGVGTFAMRGSFLAAAHRLADLPPVVQRVLRQIPPAALASLVLPALLRPDGQLSFAQPRLAAGALAGLVAWRTRNVALTLLVGLVALVLAEAAGWS